MKKNKLDLKKLSKQLDDALNSESSESLNNWIMEQRISDNIVSSIRKFSNCFGGKYKIKFLVLEIMLYVLNDVLTKEKIDYLYNKLRELEKLEIEIELKPELYDFGIKQKILVNGIIRFCNLVHILFETHNSEIRFNSQETFNFIEDFLGIKNNYNRMISILNIIYVLDDTLHESDTKSIKKILNGIIYPNIIIDDIMTVNRWRSALDSTIILLEKHLQTLMIQHKIIGFGLYGEIEIENNFWGVYENLKKENHENEIITVGEYLNDDKVLSEYELPRSAWDKILNSTIINHIRRWRDRDFELDIKISKVEYSDSYFNGIPDNEFVYFYMTERKTH